MRIMEQALPPQSKRYVSKIVLVGENHFENVSTIILGSCCVSLAAMSTVHSAVGSYLQPSCWLTSVGGNFGYWLGSAVSHSLKLI